MSNDPSSTERPNVTEEYDRPPGEALRSLPEYLAEIREYASYLMAAKADQIKLSLRKAGMYAALGVLGLAVGGGFLITACVLLLLGVAGAIGTIFDPDRPWVGNLVVGLLVVAGAAGGVLWALRRMNRASRERMVQKYEQRQRQQRFDHGHDVAQRSAERAPQRK